MPPRADLHVRGSPKPPDFLSTPPDLLLAQAFKPPQSPVPLPTPTKLFSNQAATGKLQVDLNSEHWLAVSPPCSPAADLASHANNERATNTLEHLDVETTELLSNQAAAMYLEVDLEREHNTPAIDIQKPPTTAQPALGDFGAQSTTVLARVNDPSPISLEQPGSSANTTTTETILGQWAHGVPDVMTDETGKTLASGHALRLLSLQYPLSPVAPLSSPTSSEAATACGAGPPEGAETPLSALGPQFQELRPHSPEALLRTEY